MRIEEQNEISLLGLDTIEQLKELLVEKKRALKDRIYPLQNELQQTNEILRKLHQGKSDLMRYNNMRASFRLIRFSPRDAMGWYLRHANNKTEIIP